jgi:hypothetical protein
LFPLAGTTAKTLQRDGGWVSSKLPIKTNPGQIQSAVDRADGRPFELPDIDDAFGGDGSFRWLSDFIRFAEDPPHQLPQRRIIARLRLIDLYFRIKHPERARLIAE